MSFPALTPSGRPRVVVGHVDHLRRQVEVRCWSCRLVHVHPVDLGTYTGPCGASYRVVVALTAPDGGDDE